MKVQYEASRDGAADGTVTLDAEQIAAYRAATDDEARRRVIEQAVMEHADDVDDWETVDSEVQFYRIIEEGDDA